MPYQTQPGTIPHRVVEWFKKQDVGTEATAAALGEALEVDSNSFSTWLAPARKAGLLRAATKRGEGRTLFWSLGDGTPEPDPEDSDDDTPPTSDQGGSAGELEEVEFNAAAWADGDVDLYGLIALEDGGHRMTAAMVNKLKRLITWMPAT